MDEKTCNFPGTCITISTTHLHESHALRAYRGVDPHVTMEEGYELDLTYITERIIAVSFPRGCSEGTYLHNLQDVTRMLRSKHADNYLVINLSERRYDLTRMNPKTFDMGWPDLHAPALDKICSICKAMENWLNAHPQHVVVIHCRGGKDRIGVIISSYVYFTNISASADQALDRFAMRKFYDDKVSGLMTPSQKRYVWILNSLLTGAMKMNPSPLFLHCVVLHEVPNFDSNGVCQPYLKVYQAMQAVYTSGIYLVGPGHKSSVCIALEPAQMLKGDIMIKCYHRDARASSREVIFRLQFHTGAVQGCSLVFEKSDLESANNDHRFPDYGKVELVFSESPEKIREGSDRWQNGPDVTVDYNTADPLIRWDSYETITTEGEVPHAQGPVDGSLYAKVRKRSVDGALPPVTSSPDHSEHALSTGSDSGHSSASLWTKRGPSRQERAELKRLLSGISVDAGPGVAMTERRTSAGGVGGRVLHVVPAQVHVNGDVPGVQERETDILDDEVPSHDLRSVDSIGTLSSSEGPCSNAPSLGQFGYHKSSQNSLLSDGFGSHTGEESHAPLGGPEDYDRSFREPKLSGPTPVPQSVSPKPQVFSQGCYSTHSWVQQQQMVAAQQYPYLPSENEVSSPKPATVLQAPTRGRSSAEAVQRIGGAESPAPSREDELSALTVDIDQSIDQLNQLIMDLDPTFVPIPTRSNSVKKGHMANGPVSVCTNGVGRQHSPADTQPSVHQSVGVSGDVRGGGTQSLSPQGSDVTGRPELRTPGWSTPENFQNSPLYSPSLPPTERGLFRKDSLGFRGPSGERDCWAGSSGDGVPPTPAFPVSPPTPYVKNMAEFSLARLAGQSSRRHEAYRMTHEPRGYVENMNHTSSSADGDLFCPGVSVTPTSCQRPFGSLRSMSPGSPLLQADSRSAGQPWQEGANKTPLNQQFGPLDYPRVGGASDGQHSPLLSHPAPNCHSSPRGGPRSQSKSALDQASFEEQDDSGLGPGPLDLSSILEGPGLEQSLLAAVEGLGHMGLGSAQPPLPEKKRVWEGEQSVGSRSPSLSGFSSPHSGSSVSIPFPNTLPEFSSRVLSASSPLPDAIVSKPETVKFVQDTSKFWYKPDISRDQAIAVLKDKEPGSFIVRDSHSFRGAYGLAMKVATPPPSVLQQSKKGGDLSNELVRHFLIECTQKGVRLKGCPNEPYFGSLTALVCQHSITPLALPCKLIIPDRDPLEDLAESTAQTASNSATELLKQGAACNVWFLGSVEMESLTGAQAVQKATSITLAMDPPPTSTVVHFKVSAQGITLTDNQRKLFFRRHYAVNTVIFCALDPQDRKWMRESCSSAKIFGFVARKTMSGTENVCHLFAEHDPEQPASAIVNFVSKGDGHEAVVTAQARPGGSGWAAEVM
ncbi:hypothetical protein GJAV_G00068620 [Gymnothorax javanicus]|nr:hypothetical protein GJAV_G00068620 [Gymnothorax javanicus]